MDINSGLKFEFVYSPVFHKRLKEWFQGFVCNRNLHATVSIFSEQSQKIFSVKRL